METSITLVHIVALFTELHNEDGALAKVCTIRTLVDSGASKHFCDFVPATRMMLPGHFIEVFSCDDIALEVVSIRLIIAWALPFGHSLVVLHSHPQSKESHPDNLSSKGFI